MAQHRYESPEVGSAAGRMLRALARRAAAGDLEAIEQLVELGDVLDEALVEGARGAHAFGYSWTQIGEATGTTRQAARQRFAG